MESAAIHSSEVHEVDSGIPMTLFKGFSTSLSLLQGELHLSHQAFSIVFTTPSVPLVGDRNLRRKDVTALQCYICPTCPSPAGGSLPYTQALNPYHRD